MTFLRVEICRGNFNGLRGRAEPGMKFPGVWVWLDILPDCAPMMFYGYEFFSIADSPQSAKAGVKDV